MDSFAVSIYGMGLKLLPRLYEVDKDDEGDKEGHAYTWRLLTKNDSSFASLLITKAYEDILNILINERFHKNHLFIGTPGVGKTTFITYLLWYLMTENATRFTRLCVDTQEFKGWLTKSDSGDGLWESDIIYHSFRAENKVDWDKTVYIYDAREGILPEILKCVSYIFHLPMKHILKISERSLHSRKIYGFIFHCGPLRK